MLETLFFPLGQQAELIQLPGIPVQIVQMALAKASHAETWEAAELSGSTQE